MIGRRYGRLIVQGRVRRGRYVVRCDCGRTKEVAASALYSGDTRSCGCLRDEATAARSTKHGHANRSGWSPTYRSWACMLRRCSNKRDIGYKNYGGRGIKVCARWSRFENFLTDMGERPAGRSLDRINNDGNYEPGNCRWATRSEQNRSQRRWKRR